MINYINDEQYECWLCKKALVYDAYQKSVVEVDGRKEHVCNPPISTTPKPKEPYLSLQNHESKLAREYDEYFAQKKSDDMKKQASELEKYNRRMSYDKRQRLMQGNVEKVH